MTPLVHLRSPVCRLPLSGVDTDQILSARFMSQPRSAGYGGFLLHDLAHTPEGDLRADFPLNSATGAQILVARRNFGGGSSREGAAYALVDRGFRCVIAPSFGDIFAANAANNGLLAAQVDEDVAERLLAGRGEAEVDLQACEIRAGAEVFAFRVDPVHRAKLLNGWNDVDLTLSFAEQIKHFAMRDAKARPWLSPAKGA